jgi:hypothetical protein
MTLREREQFLCARLEAAGGKAPEITRAEFAELLHCAPELIEYKPRIAGAGAYAGYSPTFANRPLSYV